MIEFLERTDHHNLIFNINVGVQNCLEELKENLKQRMFRLWSILDSEDQQYYEELKILAREKMEESAKCRHEWLGMCRLKRELEEEKFLKCKKEQREIENSEKNRYLESKNILLETKKAQLYQMKEKERLRQKEHQMEQMWYQVMMKCYEDREKKIIFEENMRKTVADINQTINLDNVERQHSENTRLAEALRKEITEDDNRATRLDELYRAYEKIIQQSKKLKADKILREQMMLNKARIERQRQKEILEDAKRIKENNTTITKEICQREKQTIQEVMWQNHFMEHIVCERKNKRDEAEQFDKKYLGTGCVLSQKNKIPYTKSVRLTFKGFFKIYKCSLCLQLSTIQPLDSELENCGITPEKSLEIDYFVVSSKNVNVNFTTFVGGF